MKYLLIEFDIGGFNNIRMSFENYIVLAKLTKRILVLPPPQKVYHLDQTKSYGFQDFFDLDNLAKYIDWIPCSQHPVLCQTNQEYKDFIKNQCYVFHWDGTDIISEEYILDETQNRKIHFIDELQSHPYIANSARLLNHPCCLYHFTDTTNKQIKQFLFDSVKFHPHIRNIIQRIISQNKSLARLNYYAIHIRRGDLQYPFIRNNPIHNIYLQVRQLIPLGSIIYIATDEKDKSQFSSFFNDYNVLFYDSVKPNNPIDKSFIPLVEMGICVMSQLFIGTRLSTFSGYIFIMRGYQKHYLQNKHEIYRPYSDTIYFTQSPDNQSLQPYILDEEDVINDLRDIYREQHVDSKSVDSSNCWVRPYKNFWDF